MEVLYDVILHNVIEERCCMPRRHDENWWLCVAFKSNGRNFPPCRRGTKKTPREPLSLRSESRGKASERVSERARNLERDRVNNGRKFLLHSTFNLISLVLILEKRVARFRAENYISARYLSIATQITMSTIQLSTEQKASVSLALALELSLQRQF